MKHLGLFMAIIFCANISFSQDQKLSQALNQALIKSKPFMVKITPKQYDTLKKKVHETAVIANSLVDLKEGLEMILDRMVDPNAVFVTINGQVIASKNKVNHNLTKADHQTGPKAFSWEILDESVGYFKIFKSADDVDINILSSEIRSVVDTLSKKSNIKWVVDLREAHGEHYKSFLVGLGPLLGEGMVAGYVDGNSKIEKMWEVHNGRFYDDQQLIVHFATPRDLRHTKVAVLISEKTQDAGELISVTFKGRRHTKFFGTPTAGNLNKVDEIPITDELKLLVTTHYYQDRKGYVHHFNIHPDHEVTSDGMQEEGDAVLQAALKWLHIDSAVTTEVNSQTNASAKKNP